MDVNGDAVIVISDDDDDAALDLRVVNARYHCGSCEFSCADESVLKRHVRKHLALVCDVCNRIFKDILRLRFHTKKYHGGLITCTM